MAGTTQQPLAMLATLVLLTSAMPMATAQQTSEDPAPGFHPAVAVSTLYDDNVLRTDTNAISDTAAIIAPALSHLSLFGKHSLQIDYFGAYAGYMDESDEDYNDHNLDADLLLDLTPQLDISLAGEYIWSHDERGASGGRTTQSSEPDQWENGRIQGEILYGQRSSRGQLGIMVGSQTRQYTNNNQEARDRDSLNATATFYYHASAKTTAIIEVDYDEIDYPNPGPVNLDSVETQFLVGVKWEATRQTTGEVKLGYLDKDLEDVSLEDYDGLRISGDVVWEPQSMDRLKLAITRRPGESTQATASYYVINHLAASWEHQLTALFSFNVKAGLQRDDYSDGREDDLEEFSVALRYDLSEWIDLEAGYQYSTRDSDVSSLIYEDNQFLISLNMFPD